MERLCVDCGVIHADTRRSGTSCTPEQSAHWKGFPAPWFFRVPRARGWTFPSRERTHVQWRDGDLFLAQGWIAFKNLLCGCALGEHVGDQVQRNSCALEDWGSAHDLRIADDHFLYTRQLLQLTLHRAPCPPDLDQERCPVRDRQFFGFRRTLNGFRDLSPGCKRQQPRAFRFELQVDQLFLRQQPANGYASPCGPGRIRRLSIAL